MIGVELVGDNEAQVIISDGSIEPINLDKVHRMVEAACDDVAGVSESSVEMNSGLQFYDGMTTKEIQSILIKSAADLISLESPNYQYVAARLLLFQVEKMYSTLSGDILEFIQHYKILLLGISIMVFMMRNLSHIMMMRSGIN